MGWYSNGRFICYVLCTRRTIWILDQYIENKLASICPIFKWHMKTRQTIWHPTSFRPSQYQTSFQIPTLILCNLTLKIKPVCEFQIPTVILCNLTKNQTSLRSHSIRSCFSFQGFDLSLGGCWNDLACWRYPKICAQEARRRSPPVLNTQQSYDVINILVTSHHAFATIRRPCVRSTCTNKILSTRLFLLHSPIHHHNTPNLIWLLQKQQTH